MTTHPMIVKHHTSFQNFSLRCGEAAGESCCRLLVQMALSETCMSLLWQYSSFKKSEVCVVNHGKSICRQGQFFIFFHKRRSCTLQSTVCNSWSMGREASRGQTTALSRQLHVSSVSLTRERITNEMHHQIRSFLFHVSPSSHTCMTHDS